MNYNILLIKLFITLLVKCIFYYYYILVSEPDEFVILYS